MALQDYSGGCHCGRVRYRAAVDLSRVLSCNCSICAKRGSLLSFTTPEGFSLESGEDALTEYRFNTRNIRHLFCKVCGVASFSRGTGPDGKEMIAINARCLDGVDPAALDAMPFDGKNL